MNAQQLKNSILQEAIKGRLVPQDPNNEPASVLLERIREEKRRLVKEGKLKKKDLVETPISEDEKPFEIPESWEWCRLNHIAEIKSSKRVFEKDYVATGIPFFRSKEIGDLSRGEIIHTELFITKKHYKELKDKYGVPQKGDILLTSVGSIGNYWICDGREFYYKDGNVTQICANDNFDPRYISLFLGSQLFFLQTKASVSGTAYNALTIIKLKSLLVPLPPLDEQKRIVAKIEELMPKVEEYGKAQEALDKLNAELPEKLKKSILQEAIEGRLVPQDPNDEPASVLLDKIRKEKAQLVKEGKLKKKDLVETPISEEEKPFEIPESWEWCRLSNISLDSADGPFGSNLKREHYTTNKEVRIIQLSNIGEEGWRKDNVKYTTFSHLSSISRSEAFPEDIIIAKMMPAGRAIICPSDDEKYVLSSDAVRFDFSKNLYRKFLYYAINSQVFKNQVYGEVQGITRVRTSLSKLRTYFIPLPPLAEQQRIVAKIEELFAGIEQLKK